MAAVKQNVCLKFFGSDFSSKTAIFPVSEAVSFAFFQFQPSKIAKEEIFSHHFFFVKSTLVNSKNVAFTKFLSKKHGSEFT